MAHSLQGLGKIPELRKRLLYTLGMLAVYRLGIFVTVPGIDREIMANFIRYGETGLLGLADMFSGGAVSQMSVFALGVMPYISASIIFQLLGVVIPALERLQKEGDQGRRKINQYTRYATVALSIIQGLGISVWLQSLNAQAGTEHLVRLTGFTFKFLTVLSLTSGTLLLMWMGEQISDRGIGNGISMIIFAGIVAQLPTAVTRTFELSTLAGGKLAPLTLLMILILIIVTIGIIVFFERAQRRIPVQYAKKVVGRKLYGGQTTSLPLKINTSGVIPPIFASSILMFPATISNLFPGATWVMWLQSALIPGEMLYNVVYVALIVFFTFFYTAVTFNPVDVADNLKKNGGFVPGIRAGKATADYIDRVLSRITVGGAIYISAVCVLPTILQQQFGVPFYFGGTSLLIVVGVALDLVAQIESHLISRNYEGFAGAHGPRMRGRRDGG
ncbi:MAG TPA: preprotein translocase subunit SecY [Myxococcota bacterium]|nr:preprotein translocase subunit SecY [Myxococcota bacterium]HON25828.1 preprotein translocase subunit SecY [Myxococcota bacterium]HOS61618.1 preprotein translocase subunit SecY [Myxococcota bacterium]HPC91526.1 preprotein translocase subunit SecY [Myxococcota bacterium]HPL24797.1 preprotein translocase subunit SecY [Myxococcota bacterium]